MAQGVIMIITVIKIQVCTATHRTASATTTNSFFLMSKNILNELT